MSDAAGDELVDVVDDAGATVAVASRRVMRAERLPHRCCYVLVFDRHGNLLVHLRTPIKDVYPSHWDVCVGGVVAAGETFDQAALREVREEIGVDAPLDALFPFRFSDEATVVHGLVYRARHDGPFRWQPEEVVRGEFLSLDAVADRARRDPFCPDGLAVLARYRAALEEAPWTAA